MPTLIVHADDDPFIRFLPETHDALAANPWVTYIETRHGGHCAFLAPPNAATGYDGYWAEQVDIQRQIATAWVLYAEGKPDEALAGAARADLTSLLRLFPGTVEVPPLRHCTLCAGREDRRAGRRTNRVPRTLA